MCRFVAYLGNPLILDEVLYKPKNSLIKQSVHAMEMDEPLNGDGFGLGWYAQDIDNKPGLFRSIQPAWNDQNLQYLATKLRSNCFFAHIRAASSGGVSINNCHPFHYKNLLFMHNGDIGGFRKIKRYLEHRLSDEIYDGIKGQTDSEHFFALLMEHFNRKPLHFTAPNIAKVFKETLSELEKIQQKHQNSETSYLNTVVTDGKSMVATRYVSDLSKKAPTLYYAQGSHYEYHEGHCHIHPSENNENGAVLITSERLTSYHAEWREIPVNHMLLVHDDLSTSLQAI